MRTSGSRGGRPHGERRRPTRTRPSARSDADVGSRPAGRSGPPRALRGPGRRAGTAPTPRPAQAPPTTKDRSAIGSRRGEHPTKPAVGQAGGGHRPGGARDVVGQAPRRRADRGRGRNRRPRRRRRAPGGPGGRGRGRRAIADLEVDCAGRTQTQVVSVCSPIRLTRPGARTTSIVASAAAAPNAATKAVPRSVPGRSASVGSSWAVRVRSGEGLVVRARLRRGGAVGADAEPPGTPRAAFVGSAAAVPEAARYR